MLIRTLVPGATLVNGEEQPAPRPSIDSGIAAGKCLLDMLGVFAEFETTKACRSLDFQIEFAH
jgi:hypothetical protein